IAGGVGRLTDTKGFEHLLAAAAEARANGIRLEVVLVGDGPRHEALTAEARRLGIGSAVHFLGRRGDPDCIYPALDLFVLSSLREGSPNVLLEAMACGIAAIATRVGGVPELIDDGDQGLLIPPGDPKVLATALQRLATDPALRHRLGQAARERVERELTVERMVEKHEALYEGLLS
ncbi:MAG: glycosyltransferase, partial [Acidobacteriota bacterium]